MERIRFEDDGVRWKMTVRHARHPGLLAAGIAVLCLFAVMLAGAFALGAVDPDLALLAFQPGIVVVMLTGPALALAGWYGGGSEVVESVGGTVRVSVRVFGIPVWRKRFDPAAVRWVRYAPTPLVMRRHPLALLADQGDVAFDYGSRTVRFGRELSDRAAEVAARVGGAVASMEPHPAGAAGLKPSRVRVRDMGDRLELRLRWLVYLRAYWSLVALFAVPTLLGAIAALVMPSEIGRIAAMTVVIAFPVILGFSVAVYLPVQEVAVLHAGALWLGTIVYGVRTTGRSYPLGYVSPIRYEIQPNATYAEAMSGWLGQQQGLVAFDYGGQTFRFGKWISDAEAQEVAAALNAWWARAASRAS